ncbi:hypothetical protein NP233_g2651 [Leucocoprinus birnbaumii]|uniref:NACHT domain-containing protein n=1 Tax=Leucocoprinus birnbaumii TaxID=56174 RepID=A0AAD5VY08_9AGAR|nr:hypothetical protein NP233_g2651 [Leucocoprinus birnbaumii]
MEWLTISASSQPSPTRLPLKTLLDKELEVQFRELIIAPFLELQNLLHPLPQKVVFIDGLDECGSDPAQTKIIDLITKSVITYGQRVPLIWALFSRPETHLSSVLSRHIKSLLVWTIHLQVSRDHDNDIRVYFRNSLRVPTSFDDVDPPTTLSAWPSEEDLEILVTMVAGLFIYAVTVVRFIMDKGALSPQRQLREVLEFYSERDLRQPSKSTKVTSELDAFYSLIMGRIPPQQLLVVRQILLIVHTTGQSSLPIRIPAIIMGLALPEVKNSLSMLCSVLELQQYKFMPWEWEQRRWPGSATLYFYHASFMEFLWDQERSKEYCIQDPRYYGFLAARGMSLVKEMYQMNGLSRDDRHQQLRKLLSVFPDESSTPETCLNFRDELLYDYLYAHTMSWYAHSGDSVEASEAIRAIAGVVNLSYFFFINKDELKLLSEENCQLVESHRLLRHRWPTSLSPTVDVQNTESTNVPPHWNVLWTSIMSILDLPVLFLSYEKQDELTEKLSPLLHEASKNRRLSKYIRSKLTHSYSSSAQIALARAKEVDLDALTDVELLDYYSYEWYKDLSHGNVSYYLRVVEAPRTFISAIVSPWIDFFVFIQGDSRRLTRAACSLLARRRNGELTPYLAPSIDFSGQVLLAFANSVEYRDWGSQIEEELIPGLGFLSAFTGIVRRIGWGGSHLGAGSGQTQIETEIQQAAEAYYRAEKPIIFNDSPTSYLNRVANIIKAERSNGMCPEWCIEVLMEDHWTELFGKVGEILASGNDPDDCLGFMLDTIHWSRQRIPRLQHIFGEHIRTITRNTISEWGEDGMPSEKIRACASALLDIKEHQYEKAQEVLGRYDDDPYRHAVDQAFYEVLDSYPVWRHAVNEVLAEQEGGVLRALFSMDTNAKADFHEPPPPTQSGQQSRLDSKPHSSQGSLPSMVEDQIVSSSVRESKGQEIVGESDNTPSDGQAYQGGDPGVSNQKGGSEKVRKRDKLAKSIRRFFKRN